MMGERVGGEGDGPRKPNPKTIYGPKGGKLIEEVVIKGTKKSNTIIVPTFSQAPDKRMPTTMGAAIQDYRDSAPMSGYGTSMGMNIVGKGLMDQLLDFGNFLRNSFGDKSDYSGLGPRMTKWDGNTMSATESQDAKFNALLTADGLVTAGISNIGSASSSKLNILSAEEMANIWGSGPRIDPQNLHKNVTSDFVEILAGRGVPQLDEFGVQQIIQNRSGVNPKWVGAKEWKIRDLPGTTLNGSRIVQHPNGKWGLVTDHDYKIIIEIPTSSTVKWK